MVEIFNASGILDFSRLDQAAVVSLAPELQKSLSDLIDANGAKLEAETRKDVATKRVRETLAAHSAAFEANNKANPPPSFFDSLQSAQRAYDRSVGIERPEPVKEKTSHPKIAHKAPADALAKAEIEVTEAREELQAATHYLRRCELAEGAALAVWINLNRPPDFESVHRAMIAGERDAKLARIADGKSAAVEPAKPTHGKSPIDQAAKQRPRQSAQQPSTPLRSAVARRTV